MNRRKFITYAALLLVTFPAALKETGRALARAAELLGMSVPTDVPTEIGAAEIHPSRRPPGYRQYLPEVHA